MRIIPVMDLQGGLAVHGVQGERGQYRAVAGILAPGGDPLALARAYAEKLALTEMYVADLDAIQGQGGHAALIADLAARSGLALMVDAGVSDLMSAKQILGLGASQVVVGLETLTGWDALDALRSGLPAERLVFSLDMKAGRMLAASPGLADTAPMQVLDRLARSGWREVILLDLARVGTGAGIDLALLSEARVRFPALNLLVGGGVRGAADLRSLAAAGASGGLVATALHTGILDRAAIDSILGFRNADE